jgi:Flp pilus assembly protein TadD
MAEGNAAAAADLYKRVFDARPELTTLIQLSRALRQSGNAQQAFLTLRNEESRFARNEGFHVEMARAALDGDFIPEAERAVTAALATPGAGWASHVINGVLLSRKGDITGARSAFNQAQSLARTEAERDGASANIAFLDAIEGRRAEAIAALEPLAAKPDAQRRIIVTLAALYGLNGDREKYLSTMRRSGLSAAEVEQGSRWLDISLAPAAPLAPIAGQRRSANQRP